MPDKKDEPAEGVAPRLSNTPDRYEDGVPVATPEDASEAESKSGQKATNKEKS